ncbi:MAG: M48 family metallopeptidase [Sphingomonadaceae bacterium]|nr:M48 family metallopeptidase [Sphingomonadaceae bacterium]
MILLHLAAATAAFDPEAATRAYLATVNGVARAKSDAYFEGGYWLILWNALVSLAIYWAMLRFGWSARWSALATRWSRWVWLRPALYAVIFVTVDYVLTLPWTIYTDFVREGQYGLMNQSFGGWFADWAKALALTIPVAAIAFAGIFRAIRRSPKRWWLWGGLVSTVFFALGAAITPVFVAPMFNTYTPMPQGPLRDRILAMAHANHIPTENVYVFDASKQSKRISANVSGLGPTIRISLNDNLLNRADAHEVAAVMGHEMGHYVLGHVWKGIIFFALLFLAGFAFLKVASERLLARYGPRWGVTDIADPGVTPLLAALATAFLFVATPVTNSFVRWHESEADAFGLGAAREPDGFARSALKLAEYRKLEPTPLEEAIFYDHPSGRTRIRMAMDWKAAHPGQ